MTYKIIPTKEFEKDFCKLDNIFRKRIINKINEVVKDPSRQKHLHPPLNNYSRIRIEKLRVLFSYDVEKKELYLEKIIFGHKY
ncbi:hypothetical protein GW932_00015 [archaeon]|nr:hypothetical protein [archaeon]